MIKKFLFVIMVFMPGVSLAVGWVNYLEIEHVRVDRGGNGYVKFKSDVLNRPSCVQAGYERMLAFDTKDAGGRSILALLLAAQASGKTIWARGTGDCTEYSQVMEDWSFGHMK